MKKLFSNVQTLKSSEDCKKYSKSVSYETLAIGATATGSAYKQTQRLSECCANYRFCKTMRFSCENLVDSLLKTLPVFRLVKILSLVVFLSAVIISESQAENTEEVTIVHSGNCGINGADNCQWSLDSKGKLTVTGSGATDNYPVKKGGYDSPWSDYRNDIFSVEVSGISTIGTGAFGHLPNLKDVYIADSVTGIGADAFWSSPMENMRISDSLTAMYNGALNGNHLTSLTIPDTLTTIASRVFGDEPDRLKNLDLICKGENCETIKMKLMNYSLYDLDEKKWSTKDISDILRTAQNEEECDSEKYYYNGRRCIKVPADGSRPCADNFKRNEKYCNRIFYTPAEAAKVLRDGDDNEITITFKK